MDLTAGYPFWLMKDGLPFQYPKLLEDIASHVTVIGGGISGALAAYFLTEAGVDCVLVDGRSIGLGSTCASTSLLQYELDKPLHQLILQSGAFNAIRSYQLCGESIDIGVRIMNDIGFRHYEMRKSLFFSSRSSQLSFMKKEFKARLHAGFDVTFLSKDEIYKDYGLNAEYGILSEKGATIDAYMLTHTLLQHSMRKGLKVYDRTKIVEINYEGGKVKVETEEGFCVRSAKLVNASGFEIVNFISKNIVDLYCTYAVISENEQEKQPLWKDRVMVWNTEDPYIYMRLTDDNRILVGGRDERFSNNASRKLYIKKAELLARDFNKLFPQYKFKSEFAWSGTFGKTKDSLPYIGAFSKTPNTFYALGFGGNGITFSIIAAQIITDLILGKINRDSEIFSFQRKSG